jgi:hypothetical protein
MTTASRLRLLRLKRAVAKPDTAAAVARRFCHALAEETAGMNPGSWRMVHTIAQRMGITFDDASSIADDCVRRKWVDQPRRLSCRAVATSAHGYAKPRPFRTPGT